VRSSRAAKMLLPLLDPIPDDDVLHPSDVVREILETTGTLTRLLEIHYLAQEPGLLEIMRGIAALAETDRDQLLKYLTRHSGQLLGLRELPTGALAFDAKPETPAGD
jgi:hypothetical protein